MKRIHVTILMSLILCISMAGCGKEQLSKADNASDKKTEKAVADELSIDTLTCELEDAVLAGETQIRHTYNGKADKLNAQIQEELETALEESYLCRTLISNVDVQWEQQGKQAEGTFTLTYQDGVEPPVVEAENEDEIVKGLIDGWEAGREKVTLILEDQSYSEDEFFAMLDGAEINSAKLSCEADSVYYQAYDPEDDMQIVKMWLEFSEDKDTRQEQQAELDDAVKKYGDEIRETAGDADDETMYRTVYQKILDLAEYDTEITAVTDLDRLSTQMRVQRSAYGALVDGNTVCTGYARGYKALCEELGLPCQVVAGIRSDINHAWNRVKIGEQYLYVDCTAGDTGTSEEEACLFTQEEMEQRGYILDDKYVIPKI